MQHHQLPIWVRIIIKDTIVLGSTQLDDAIRTRPTQLEDVTRTKTTQLEDATWIILT